MVRMNANRQYDVTGCPCNSIANRRSLNMKTRIATLLVALLLTTSLLALQPDPVTKVGDMVTVSVTGDLARDVATRLFKLPERRPLDGLKVGFVTHVREVSPDGTLYIEYIHIFRDEKPLRLTTFAGKVDPRRITTDITPKGSKVYNSPDAEPTLTKEDYLNRRLELIDLK